MEPLKKNLVVAAVLGAETLDTTGELLSVDGCDISSLKGGPINTEHLSPANMEEVSDKDFKGFTTIVGKVLDCKKIYSDKDCDNQYELNAWNDLQVPLIFGYCELWDGVHDNASAATAIARNHPDLLGFSVEGQVIKRNQNVLQETAVRAMALTMKPANRAARIQGVIQDISQNSDAINKAELCDQTVLFKSVPSKFTCIVEEDFGLSNALFKLRKALDAGIGTNAPGAVIGGATLQKEQMGSSLAQLVKLIGKKPLNKTILKKLLPNATDDQLRKVYDHLKLLRLKKHEADATDAFEQLKK